MNILVSAYIQGVIEKMGQPYPNVKVTVDDKFAAKIGSGGEFLISNVPEGDRMLLVKTLSDDLLYNRPLVIRGIDSGQVVDVKIISVDATPIAPPRVTPTISKTNILFHPEEKQADYQVALTHNATVLKKPNVFKNGVWTNGTWGVTVWIQAPPETIPN